MLWGSGCMATPWRCLLAPRRTVARGPRPNVCARHKHGTFTP